MRYRGRGDTEPIKFAERSDACFVLADSRVVEDNAPRPAQSGEKPRIATTMRTGNNNALGRFRGKFRGAVGEEQLGEGGGKWQIGWSYPDLVVIMRPR